MYTAVKDSGAREEMSSGSRRDTQEGKPRPELQPPQVSHRDGMHLANGSKKYGDHNWLLGQKSSRYLASLKRHVMAYEQGDREEDHLAAIRWNTAGIMMNEALVTDGIYPESMHDLINWDAMRIECRENGRPYTEEELRVRLHMDSNEGDIGNDTGNTADSVPVGARFCFNCRHERLSSCTEPCAACWSADSRHSEWEPQS